jgi:hypothetical protein
MRRRLLDSPIEVMCAVVWGLAAVLIVVIYFTR